MNRTPHPQQQQTRIPFGNGNKNEPAIPPLLVIPEGNLRLHLPLLVIRHSGMIRLRTRLRPCCNRFRGTRAFNPEV